MRYKIILTAIAALLSVSCDKQQPARQNTSHLQIGEKIPNFKVMTLSGDIVSDATLAGKRSVIILFNTTCPDCHKQLPEAQRAFLASGTKINFISISRDDDKETIRTYWKKNRLTLPIASGGRELYNLFDKNSGTGVPQVYVINPEGIVIDFSDDNEIMDTGRMLGEGYQLENITIID